MLLLLAKFVARLIGYCSPSLESYFNIQHDSLQETVHEKKKKCVFLILYGSIWVALFNLGCNMQNDNVICKMAMHFYIYIYIFQYICATFGAK